MNLLNKLKRETRYALLCAIAGGLLSFLMISTFIEMFNYLFVLAVTIAVFASAYFAFRRQTRYEGELTGRRIFALAAEVGTLSHFYTFALYFPLYYFLYDFGGVNVELLGTYFGMVLFMGFVSIIMFVWIAVPLYLGVGHLVKSMESNLDISTHTFNDAILDDELL